jgi:hypothetical protein
MVASGKRGQPHDGGIVVVLGGREGHRPLDQPRQAGLGALLAACLVPMAGTRAARPDRRKGPTWVPWIPGGTSQGRFAHRLQQRGAGSVEQLDHLPAARDGLRPQRDERHPLAAVNHRHGVDQSRLRMARSGASARRRSQYPP